MSTPPKLLVFAGSTRLASFNRKLAHTAAELARAAGADVTHIELADFDIPSTTPTSKPGAHRPT